MSKERLEELKGVLKSWEAWNDWNESQRIVLKDLTYYLERVQELEEDNKNLQVLSSINRKEHMRLHEQNKCYREVIRKTSSNLADLDFEAMREELSKIMYEITND